RPTPGSMRERPTPATSRTPARSTTTPAAASPRPTPAPARSAPPASAAPRPAAPARRCCCSDFSVCVAEILLAQLGDVPGVLFSQPPVIRTLEVHHNDSHTPCRYGLGKFSSLFLRSNHQSRFEETKSASASMPSSRAKSQVKSVLTSVAAELGPPGPTRICRPDS